MHAYTMFSTTGLPVTTVIQIIMGRDSYDSVSLLHDNSASKQRGADSCTKAIMPDS